MLTSETKTNTSNVTRKEYEAKVQAHLDKIDAQVDELVAKGKRAEADARINYNEFIDELETHRDAAKQRLQEVQNSTDEAWSTIQSGFESAWNELTQSFDRALKHYQ